MLRQVRVDVPSSQRAARNVVRRRQVLHHDEAQLRVKVVYLRHMLRAQPGLLPQRVCLKTRPFLQSSPILSDILYAQCNSLVLPPTRVFIPTTQTSAEEQDALPKFWLQLVTAQALAQQMDMTKPSC